ncbi:uncharacterized protein LOC132759672 isoform X2 [Ruditapes philippinarum]|nr:uncharacterized protein LOC132759672 isoform X2 [Ruditapes philippinarum]
MCWHILFVWSNAGVVKRKCDELSRQSVDELMKNITTENSKLHWSFWLLPSLQKAAEENIEHAELSVTKRLRNSFLYGEYGRRCPKRNIPNMKVCPVYYVMQNDKNRIPENIVHAQCNCKHCFKSRSSLLTGKCEKVYGQTIVWRRNETTCEYYTSLERVAVTCTCQISDLTIIPALSGEIKLKRFQ